MNGESLSWAQRRKHIFILSHAGKPVYSRYGDENQLSAFYGVLQAIVSRTSNAITVMLAGTHKFVFLLRGPLYLVAVAKCGETISHLRNQLKFYHVHITFILTAQVANILRRNAAYDLRGLLGGTASAMSGLQSMANYSPSLLLATVRTKQPGMVVQSLGIDDASFTCLRMHPKSRYETTKALEEVMNKKMLCAVLFSGMRIVTVVGPRKDGKSLEAVDLLLLANFVHHLPSLRAAESWTPICLPCFNDQGFLYAYVVFLAGNKTKVPTSPAFSSVIKANDVGVADDVVRNHAIAELSLVLVSSTSTPDQFYYSSKSKDRIVQFLSKTKTFFPLRNAAKLPRQSVGATLSPQTSPPFVYSCGYPFSFSLSECGANSMFMRHMLFKLGGYPQYIASQFEFQSPWLKRGGCYNCQLGKLPCTCCDKTNEANLEDTKFEMKIKRRAFKSVLRRYQSIHEQLNEINVFKSKRAPVVWRVDDESATLGLCCADYEVMASFSPLINDKCAMQASFRAIKWIRSHESLLFAQFL